MNAQDLAAFVAISELRNFSLAGDRLGIAQSVVSKRLRRLEQGLDLQLIDRSNRARVQLTRAGELFLAQAKAAVEQVEQSERIGRNIARGEEGPIRIGFVFSAMMSGLVSRLAHSLAHALPALKQEHRLSETPQQLKDLAAGRLDIGLLRPRLSYPEGTVGRVIHREPLIIGMSRNHRLAGRDQVECCELAGERIIIPQFQEDVGLVDAVERIATAGRFDSSELLKTDDYATAAALAAASLGIVVAPASLQGLTLPNLIYARIADLSVFLELAGVHRQDMPLAQLRALEDALQQPRRAHF